MELFDKFDSDLQCTIYQKVSSIFEKFMNQERPFYNFYSECSQAKFDAQAIGEYTRFIEIPLRQHELLIYVNDLMPSNKKLQDAALAYFPLLLYPTLFVYNEHTIKLLKSGSSRGAVIQRVIDDYDSSNIKILRNALAHTTFRSDNNGFVAIDRMAQKQFGLEELFGICQITHRINYTIWKALTRKQ